MAQEFSKPFYNSAKWQSVRRSVLQRSGGLCERCLKKGLITAAVVVHHRIILTPGNIDNAEITLNPDNLEALCQDCHAAVHADEDRHRRYAVNSNGDVIIADG